MSKFVIDKEKVLKKWAPIMNALKITDQDKINWMSEYAETHQFNEAYQQNEYNILEPYIKDGLEEENIENTPILGPYFPYTVEGCRTSYGIDLDDLKFKEPGDSNKSFNILPIAMRIAQQTIGMDLVAVNPMSISFNVESEVDRELRRRAEKAVERYKKLINLINEQEQQDMDIGS